MLEPLQRHLESAARANNKECDCVSEKNILECMLVVHVVIYLFQMSDYVSPADIDVIWEKLRRESFPRLPAQLHEPQRDALFWLGNKKNVLLAIGTGYPLRISIFMYSSYSSPHICFHTAFSNLLTLKNYQAAARLL